MRLRCQGNAFWAWAPAIETLAAILHALILPTNYLLEGKQFCTANEKTKQ